jgi:hypothetical protein
MNADLMITIAFCLNVLVGSLAVGVVVAKSILDDNAKEADAKRRPAGNEPADGSRTATVDEAAGGRAERSIGVRK